MFYDTDKLDDFFPVLESESSTMLIEGWEDAPRLIEVSEYWSSICFVCVITRNPSR
jgi:hypothetical protein